MTIAELLHWAGNQSAWWLLLIPADLVLAGVIRGAFGPYRNLRRIEAKLNEMDAEW